MSDVEDTLPQWLYWRFSCGRCAWESWTDLSPDEQAYWAHQARATRRAVARNGFRQPDGAFQNSCCEDGRDCACQGGDDPCRR